MEQQFVSAIHEAVTTSLHVRMHEFFEKGFYEDIDTIDNHTLPDDEDRSIAWRRWRYSVGDRLPEVTIRKLLRKTAVELKRPFVVVRRASDTVWSPTYKGKPLDKGAVVAWVELPKQVRLVPILSWLMLVADVAGRGSPVVISPKRSLNEFSFYGPSGVRIFKSLLARMETDPAFRTALGLTPTGNPQTKGADHGKPHISDRVENRRRRAASRANPAGRHKAGAHAAHDSHADLQGA